MLYRIYYVGADNHFIRGDAIYCASDAEALAAAQHMPGNHTAVEVWQGARKVGTVQPDRDRSR